MILAPTPTYFTCTFQFVNATQNLINTVAGICKFIENRYCLTDKETLLTMTLGVFWKQTSSLVSRTCSLIDTWRSFSKTYELSEAFPDPRSYPLQTAWEPNPSLPLHSKPLKYHSHFKINSRLKTKTPRCPIGHVFPQNTSPQLH